MLDISDPQSEWIFKASGCEDAVLTRSKLMTLVDTARRYELLDEIFIICDDMKILNKNHFDDSKYIYDAIDELYKACECIANFKVKKSDKGNCKVCDTKITHLRHYKDMIYCSKCLSITDAARSKLESSEGFGTWLI